MTDIQVEDFYWRHATIVPSVVYNKTCLGPATFLDGKIYGWDNPGGMYPFSYPKNAAAIFDSNFNKENIKYYSTVDKHGFTWYCTEEDAKSFLYNYYPEIYNEKNTYSKNV
jgi:hypothetical protein